ncbi:MAG TPA: pirin family protein [Labilithrix sp.]|nr:pirin family protein [Labilithrix sp.]
MSHSTILERRPLGFPWETADPFLFCVHHDDNYPAGTEGLGPPTASLRGRNIGQDFEGKDGWRMYHGDVVPGFPSHPHRGFETVTIMRSGYIDHSDSLGATARFGPGDVQWLTAGKGIVHCEMFPLLESDKPNPLELFQIWLNLPKEDKLVDPHFAMLWGRDVPRVTFTDDAGKSTEVTVIAGRLGDKVPPPPPPRSWASRPDTDVAIWTIKMQPGARWTLPPTDDPAVTRTIYFFRGASLVVDGEPLRSHSAVELRSNASVALEAGPEPVDILMLQGRPIGQPVVQYGPFVMNTREEIQQAVADYQRTRFGGWPWPHGAPVHARDEVRFARHADGRIERFER